MMQPMGGTLVSSTIGASDSSCVLVVGDLTSVAAIYPSQRPLDLILIGWTDCLAEIAAFISST